MLPITPSSATGTTGAGATGSTTWSMPAADPASVRGTTSHASAMGRAEAADRRRASGLDTAAVIAVASGAPVDAGLVALGVPAPTAAELAAPGVKAVLT